MTDQMRTYDLILAAARLRHVSRNAADYTSLLAVDNVLSTGDALIVHYEDDWLVSTNTGYAIRVKRNLVKPVVAGILDRLATDTVKYYHLPVIDKPWDEALLQEVAAKIRDMQQPYSATGIGHLLESVESLA